MSTPNPTGPEGAIQFRVAAIEHFSLPDPVQEEHMVLRVHYLNPQDALRGATFTLPPDMYAAHRDAIDAALISGATYWVVWDTAAMSIIPRQRGNTAVELLLAAITKRQIVPEVDEA